MARWSTINVPDWRPEQRPVAFAEMRIGEILGHQLIHVLGATVGMRVQVRFGNSEFVLRERLDFRIDVGVLAHFASDPRLHTLPYSRDPIVAFVAREHPYAAFKTIRIEQLHGQRMVVREEGSAALRSH